MESFRLWRPGRQGLPEGPNGLERWGCRGLVRRGGDGPGGDGKQSALVRQQPACHAQRFEERQVGACRDLRPGPGGDHVVQPPAGVHVEVVGGLVRQRDAGAGGSRGAGRSGTRSPSGMSPIARSSPTGARPGSPGVARACPRRPGRRRRHRGAPPGCHPPRWRAAPGVRTDAYARRTATRAVLSDTPGCGATSLSGPTTAGTLTLRTLRAARQPKSPEAAVSRVRRAVP